MRLRAVHLLLVLAPSLCAAAGADAPPQAAGSSGPVTFEKTIHPLIQQYCYECHGNGNTKGDVALDAFKTVADVDNDPKTWKTVLEKLRKHEMPPDDAAAQPSVTQRDLIADWIEKEIYQYDPANPDPGHVTLHRLNRAEYHNSIRDLVGIDFNVDDDFPPDDSGYGFDNIGDVLSLPPMLMEKYLSAADKILNRAIATEPVPRQAQHFPANLAEIGFNAIGDRGDGWVRLISLEEDDVTAEVPISAAGDYLVRFQAFGQPTGGAMVGAGDNSYLQDDRPAAPPILSIRLGDTKVKEFTTSIDEKNPGVYEARVGVPVGKARFRVVMDRLRGGDSELVMTNGKLGKQQTGIGFVKWIEVDGPLPGATTRYPADQLATTKGEGPLSPSGARVLTQNGDVSVKFNVPKAGEYILRAYGYAMQAGPDPARMELRVDDKPLQTFDVLAPGRLVPLDGQKLFSPTLLRPIPQVYETHVTLGQGEKKFSAAFLNALADPANANPNLRQRELVVQSLEIVDLSAPALLPQMPAVIQQYFAPPVTAQNQTARAREILTQFTRRAWRRPAAPAEIDRLMGLYDLSRQQGDSFDAGVKLAMKAVLVSPNFLFRSDVPQLPMLAAAANSAPANPAPDGFVEEVKMLLNPDDASVPPATPTTVAKPNRLGVPLDEFSLASRLSYFLWSSTPDDELLDLAQHNQLRTHLPAEVRRMLASPKSRALVDNFASQWLQFRSLSTFEPDKTMFPDFNPALRADMQTETEMFFEYIMRHDRSVLDFLTADYTFVNGPLAKFYGLPAVSGEDFQKVSLVGTPRRGVLTQGSVLVLTSNPTRTSPVKRGKWVLENLLGTPPPPPPPDVPVLDDEHQLTGTLREQMEQHRANPVCASCHARMDPIGFSLENFDATGAWRDKDGSAPVDASGTLVSGESFSGAAELADLLADKKRDDFLHCMAEKMLTYALGRGLEYYDRAATDQIVQQLNQNGDKFSALVLGVVNSLPFQQMRRTPAAPLPPADKVAGE